MNQERIPLYQRLLEPVMGLAICVSLMPGVHAARTASLVEQFTADAVSASGPERAGRIDIYLEEWSSEAEMARLQQALRQADAATLLSLLHQQKRRVGVLLMPGVQGRGARSRTRTPRNLLFARDVTTPTGRQIIVIADEHLGLGEPALEARKQVPEFNLLDIRFGPDGKGVGKVVAAADITYNAKTGVVEVKDFSTRPARLIDVLAQTP